MALKNFLERINQGNGGNERPTKPLSSNDAGVDIHCTWLKKDVLIGECHKPCFHRDDNDRPVECQHLKTWNRERMKELGLNEAVNG